jgi:hypothetical protein
MLLIHLSIRLPDWSKIYNITDLSPPGLALSTEVSFSPGGEDDSSGLVSCTVGKSKWKRSWSTNNSSSGGVLREEDESEGRAT